MHLEAFLIDRLHADEHVLEPERLPELEHLLVAQQNIAARLHVILFLDPSPSDRFADLHALFRLDEGHVVDHEDARFLDRAKLFHGLFRADRPITATVKRPGAAEGTIPGAASRKLDRGAGVQHTDEILVSMTQQIARRTDVVQVFDELRGADPRRRGVMTPGHLRDRLRSCSTAVKQLGTTSSPSPLSTQSIAPVPCSRNSLATNEALCPPTKTMTSRQLLLGELREIHDFRHIRQIITGERHGVGLPGSDECQIIFRCFRPADR